MTTRRFGWRMLGAVLFALALAAPGAEGGEQAIKIGVLADMSGFAADAGGRGALLAARLAVDDTGGKVLGKPVELVAADMQNKPDVAATLARQWFEQDDVDAIADLPVSSVALAVQAVARERHKVLLISAAATTDLTGRQCSPWTIHFADDTSALSQGTARAVVASGGQTWFFITADFAFGHALERDAAKVIEAAGGKVVGRARHPLAANDFSSFVLAAQASKAQVVALANAAGDTINSIKQANEFGLPRGGQSLAAFLLFVTDVHTLGLATAHGLFVSTGFYWNASDQTRAFSKRFMAEHGKMPTKEQANTYAAVLNYLKAIEAARTDRADAVIAAYKSMKLDYFGKPASVRPDGRVLYDLALYKVKEPSESKGPWDYYKKVTDIPAKDAFLPIEAGGCGFLAK